MRLSSLFSILLLNACASINPLEGGDKDTSPPKITSTNLQDTNFKSKQIEIEFDEFIQLNDPDKNIKIYPEHSKLKCSIIKKKVIIKFDTLLHENTTYYLRINQGIKDVHEGNPFSYDKLFSTGSHIDSGRINLEIINPNGIKNLKVSILENLPSDSLRQFDPYYTLNVTNTNIQFLGLKNKIHSIWIYTDNDQNNKPDWYNPIGFETNIHADTSITIEVCDWNPKLKINKVLSDGVYTKIKYDNNKNYYKIIDNLYKDQLERILYANEDSCMFEDFKYTGHVDSCKPIDPYEEMHSMILSKMQAIQGKQFVIDYQLPAFYSNKVTSLIPRNEKTIYNKRKDTIQIYVPRIEDMDTLDITSILSKDENKMSHLSIQVEDSSNRKLDILIKKEGKLVKKIIDEKNYETFLEPGTYSVEIYESEIDHDIDPFNLKKSGEKKYSKTLILKASWEEILQIKIE